MTGDDLAEKVAAVLGEHRCNYHHRNVGPEPVSAENLRSCEGCDWLGGHHDEAGWEVHLAAALLPLIREREAAAWERALREAASGYLHTYPEIYDDLRDRAAANPYAGSEATDDRA
jgi:hypothetical protein